MFKRSTYLDHLARVPMFSTCTKSELATIAQHGTDLVFDAGHSLVREGTAGYEFFVIVDGEAEVSRGGETVAKLGPGDFFGELALLSNEHRDATVTAITRLEAIVVSSQELRALLEGAPNLTFKMLAGMAHRLHDLDTRVAG